MQLIAPFTAEYRVMAACADDRVIAAQTVQIIVALVSVGMVAFNVIIVVAAEDGIVTGPAVQNIFTGFSIQIVVAVAPVDLIITDATEDEIIAAIASDMGLSPEQIKGLLILSRTVSLIAHSIEENQREKPWRGSSQAEITQPLDLSLQRPEYYDGPSRRSLPEERTQG